MGHPTEPLKDRSTTYPPAQPKDTFGNAVQVLRPEPSSHLVLDGSGPSEVKSGALAGQVIRVVAIDSAAYIEFGTNPTASATDMILPANTPEYFRINYGEQISIYGAIVDLTIMR